jgi:hypothetical protein
VDINGVNTSLIGSTIAIIPRSLQEIYRQNQLPDSSVWPRGQYSYARDIFILNVYMPSQYFFFSNCIE